jgi:hypothetical protein
MMLQRLRRSHGDLAVDLPRIIRGVHQGSVTVLDGGELVVRGTVTGSVAIQQGGAAMIHGRSGAVTVEGGGLLLLPVAGRVTGALHVHARGRAEVAGRVGALQADIGASVVRQPGAVISGEASRAETTS